MLDIFFLITFVLSFILFIWLIIDSKRYGITPTPSSFKVRLEGLRIFKRISDREGGIEEIVDLGHGFGSVARTFARNFPKVQVVGYEVSLWVYAISKVWQLISPLKNLKLHCQDYRKANLKDSKFIFCYLYCGAMQEIADHYESMFTPGTWILTHTFAIPDWDPVEVIYVEDLYQTPLILYRVPERIDPKEHSLGLFPE